jgi:Nucleotidyl transferase of unknown function (DUF2204)
MLRSATAFDVSETSALASVLAAVADVLRSGGLRWYVFGAQAVLAYGRPRLTADLDITVAAEIEQVPELVSRLRGAGLLLQPGATEAFVRRTRVLPFVHEATGIPVDIVLAGPGLEEAFIANARDLDVAGVTVPVISPEDLVVTKILAGRPKDIDDVDGILREQLPALDLDRCRRFLSMLEEALARNDLLPALDEALARTRSRPA